MLIFEPADCLYWTRYCFPDIVPYKLNSKDTNITENIMYCNINIPDEIARLECYEQESAFAEYMIYNEVAFMSYMQIIDQLYNGNDVVIVIEPESLISELLGNFIYTRYGYNHIIVNEPEDVMPLMNMTDEDRGSFSIQGLSFLDCDINRYGYGIEKLLLEKRIRNGEPIYSSTII